MSCEHSLTNSPTPPAMNSSSGMKSPECPLQYYENTNTQSQYLTNVVKVVELWRTQEPLCVREWSSNTVWTFELLEHATRLHSDTSNQKHLLHIYI